MSIIYWILVLLVGLAHGYIGFGPNGNRFYGGGGVLLVLILILIGLRLFPIAS